MIDVYLPSQLERYTNGVREVVIDPDTLAMENFTLMDVINELDKRYPGMAFRIVDEQRRIRRHIAMFVGEAMVRDLNVPLTEDSRVQIVGALSGG